MAAPPPLNGTYYVFHEGESQGPYDLQFIEAMVLSGHFPTNVSISKDGKTGWKSIVPYHPPSPPPLRPPDQAMPPPAPAERPLEAPPNRGNKNYGCFIVLAIIVGIYAIGGIASHLSTSSPPSYQPTAASVPEPTPQVDNSTYSAPTTYTPPTYTPQPAPQAVYQPPPVYQPPQPQTYAMTGQDGQVYTISLADYQVLHPRKLSLDAWSAKLDESQRYVDALGRQVELDRPLVDNTSEESVENFNLEVDKYNRAADELKQATGNYNAAVDAFNADLERVGTPQSR